MPPRPPRPSPRSAKRPPRRTSSSTTASPNSPYDTKHLRSLLDPWRLHYIPTCRSTNDLAVRMRREGRLYAPAIILTPRQTAGRGRGSNRWSSDPGTLTATFAIPVDAGHPPHQLPLVAGLAVRDAIAHLLGGSAAGGNATVQLKWPNDVLIDGRKVAGLLCERADNVDLIGTGINISTHIPALPSPIQARATSLELAGRSCSLTEALLAVADRLHRATQSREPFTAVLRRYDAHHILVGRVVTVRTTDTETVSGLCKGLDSVGRLLIAPPGGHRPTERLIAGQVISY